MFIIHQWFPDTIRCCPSLSKMESWNPIGCHCQNCPSPSICSSAVTAHSYDDSSVMERVMEDLSSASNLLWVMMRPHLAIIVCWDIISTIGRQSKNGGFSTILMDCNDFIVIPWGVSSDSPLMGHDDFRGREVVFIFIFSVIASGAHNRIGGDFTDLMGSFHLKDVCHGGHTAPVLNADNEISGTQSRGRSTMTEPSVLISKWLVNPLCSVEAMCLPPPCSSESYLGVSGSVISFWCSARIWNALDGE